MSELERSYRRLLRLHPRRWRRYREQEVLAVLLQAADPGQTTSTPAEVADLLRSAAREHARATARAARLSPGRTAASSLLVAGSAVVLLGGGEPVQARASVLPRDLPAYSYLTQSVSTSPPGPAVAVYRQGTGAELADVPQAVVVGAGGSVRRLDLAEGRGTFLQGSPSSFLLSPDGTHVASGRYDDAGRADVAVQDLSTGEVTTTGSLGHPSAHPVAWSPDGTAVLVALEPLPWLAPGDQPVPVVPDRLALVSLDGGLLPLPVGVPAGAGQVAWAPDGRDLVVQGPERQLSVVDVVTGRSRPTGTSADLAGPQPWSPDGALLAVRGACSPQGRVGQSFFDVLVVPADPVAPALPAPVCLPGGATSTAAVGWAAPRVLVVEEAGEGSGEHRVVAVDLVQGTRTPLSAVPTASGEYQVSDLQVPQVALAGALAATGEPEAPPAWDRGPLSHWPEVALVSGVVGVLVALVAAAARRVGTAPRRTPGEAGGPPASELSS
ncbi:hypothetical protein [Quadrisphaera sp. KR29]|uniref:hypothetical protein n=1 Tax=Quadrisphaera sp. KR29 TaxID=3461391 RepID=UPI0040441509